MDAALQASVNARQSDRLRQALRMTPHFLDVYFGVALRDVSDCMFPFISRSQIIFLSLCGYKDLN